MKKYEELEHTADLGLRIFGSTLAELLEHAAEGMFSLIGRAEFRPSELRLLRIHMDRPGPEPPQSPADPAPPQSSADAGPAGDEALLHAWLKRLLQEFNRSAYFPVTVRVEVIPAGLSATLRGGTFDPAAHTFHTEIKGVTLHALKVARINSCWQADVIFDV